MTTARWSDEEVRHGGCLQKAPAAKQPGRRGCAVVRGASRASLKTFTEDRDGRRLRDRTPESGESGVKVRRRKVQVLHRRIKEGTYDLDWRLATILDKMVEDIAAQMDRGERP